ncbi:hypothetical protein M758_4G151600 [Ceratodon purpureus]|nr:hypothetical protein M758_4G150500 [Ceratodon purpureus]KAG0619602.1 hypothetical protein M758_4G151600 [Ceratodon purpureus]
MAQRPCKDPTLFHLNKSTGRFSAWVRRPNDGNKRHYIGCYTTFHMAARAQDRATLKINARAPVNFKASDYDEDIRLRAAHGERAFLTMLRNEARPTYNVVLNKSPCYVKFQNMENEMEELRRVTKFTIQQFVAHLATNPTRSPEMNQAAEILLEIFATHTPGTDEPRMPRRVAVASSPEFDIFARDIPKGKRSPRAWRTRAAGGGSEERNRPRTRSFCKRKLAMSHCPYRRPRS